MEGGAQPTSKKVNGVRRKGKMKEQRRRSKKKVKLELLKIC